MKIALGLEYPLKVRGGVGVLVEKLIEGVSERHEVLLVSPDAPGTKTPGTIAHVHWDPSQVSRRTSQELAGKLADLGVSLAHFHLGGNYGWGNRIPRQSPFPYLRQRGIASISTVHMALSILDGYCDPRKSVWFKIALLPITWLGKLDALRNVSAEVVVSQQGCERLKRWYWPFRNKFRAIYHSRLPDALPPLNPSREPLIIAVGHIAFRKGQHTLAAAFAKIAAAHPAWKLALLGPVGDAACMSQIEATISAHKLQDQILLMGSRDDTSDFMRRAAILVQPSLYEGLPLALQEGMRYGCAAVATRVIGNEELILDGTTGLLVPPDNPGALALALDGLMKDPARRERFGRASSAAIVEKGMTASKMVEQHLALYDRIGRESSVGVESASKARHYSGSD